MNKALSNNGIKLGKHKIRFGFAKIYGEYRLYHQTEYNGQWGKAEFLCSASENKRRLKNMMNVRIRELRKLKKYN